ncbi:MAG: ABC transporter permease [Armatimonadetes bacterium]|nr:ABC transporter permease [Armatimonadota bacterium]
MQSLRRILAVIRKELRVLLRDRLYLFMAIVLPALTMVTMGYGIAYDIKNLPLGVADLDRSTHSRQFIDRFTTSGYFRLVMVADQTAALDRALDAGRIRVAVVIPPGFARTLYRGQPAAVQILMDGSLTTRAEIATGYVKAIVARFNDERLRAIGHRGNGGDEGTFPRLEVLNRIWFNPTLESKNFLVPGLLVISLLFWTPVIVSLSVTREKETGAILNIQTAPITPWEYVAGKLLPYAAVSFIGYWLLLLASVVLFRVPVKGSAAVLTAGAFIYIVGMTGLGLLISMLVRTQVAALLATAVIVMAVGLFYSGWTEPVATLDASGQALSRLLPTAGFMTLTRGVFLKGLGFAAYRGTLVTLGLYAAVYTLLAVLAFRKRRR